MLLQLFFSLIKSLEIEDLLCIYKCYCILANILNCVNSNWNASHPLLRATLEVVVKPDRGQSGPRERLMEQFIASTCDSLILTKRHPHTAISIILQVEKDDGAVSLYSHSGDEWR